MKNLIILFLISLFYVNCEAKPEKEIYGIPNDDKEKFIAGYILNQGSTSTSVGTVIDSRNGLEWKKCSQGQSFRQVNNDCQGAGNSASPTVNVAIGSYGATQLAYCDLQGNFCNTLSIPQILRLDEMQKNKANSEAFYSCLLDRTGGFTNWRVPNPVELKLLTTTGRTAMLFNFPNTPEETYWSSWSNELDATGSTAKGINFSTNKFGEDANTNKTTRLLVRCVRNTNGT